MSPNENGRSAGHGGPRFATWVGLIAVAASLAASLYLLAAHRVLGGPGHELVYYKQAERLIPFTHNYYGPGYFVTIRVVHDLFGADWFLAGKVTSWVSACLVLLFTFLVARRLLGRRTAMLVLALVALNPTFIEQSYSSLTMMYGAAWALGSILAVTSVSRSRPPLWFLAGLVFGLGALTRFQNNTYLLGALAGTLILPGVRVAGRLARVAWLAAGAVLPVVAWNAFLRLVQGGAPPNYNFVHLTWSLGEFTSFLEATDLIKRYGSTWGVLTSHPTVPARILAYATKEALKFPFGNGFHLLFLAAGWLLPGLVAVAYRRRLHGPWIGAFAVGLFLTGLGPGWLSYFVPFLPFTALLVASAIRAGSSPRRRPGLYRLSWVVVLGSTALWAPFMVRASFRGLEWTEFAAARRYLEAHRGPETVVSCTAASLPYGTGLAFVDQSGIMRPGEEGQLVDRLRRHGVTHLVVTERHTLWEFPNLENLLEEPVKNLPPGLRRELLIERPQRLAIYRVLPK